MEVTANRAFNDIFLIEQQQQYTMSGKGSLHYIETGGNHIPNFRFKIKGHDINWIRGRNWGEMAENKMTDVEDFYWETQVEMLN